MLIRSATRDDSPAVIPLLMEAIGSIAYMLTGASNEREAAERLSEFYRQPGNRISFEHVLVAEQEGELAGMLVAYSGDDANELDEPFRVQLSKRWPELAKSIVREAQDGEYYLDALAVAEPFRGQGLAKRLMAAAERRASELGFDRTTLIVEAYNDKAYRLYKSGGYKEDGVLRIGDSDYRRMVKRLN
ncbi:GNAT family N-acetyltransferase [Paenibacillus montanisoli]|uniref:GNAT family N-acetyltransferase n=1 Tax=Paenibacillus montanisoli TaxID=2081970 RepID=A0A328U5Q0_9BACL|nr:GNAT family N-acetyltransferase [Paenibacillus montanisoli]RAP75256.1 GNAT family N-acetyltransferase [Paenibacillus montanisoli]